MRRRKKLHGDNLNFDNATRLLKDDGLWRQIVSKLQYEMVCAATQAHFPSPRPSPPLHRVEGIGKGERELLDFRFGGKHKAARKKQASFEEGAGEWLT